MKQGRCRFAGLIITSSSIPYEEPVVTRLESNNLGLDTENTDVTVLTVRIRRFRKDTWTEYSSFRKILTDYRHYEKALLHPNFIP